jgi:alpha/beta superfamily hydrolase
VSGTADPLWLDVVGGPVAAWWHAPALGVLRQPRALVLSHGIGVDGAFGRPAVQQVALALASRGVCVLRFDPPGAGDSSGSWLDDGVVGVWQASFEAAVAEAMRRGAAGVDIGGVRLAGLVAATAWRRSGATRLLAWAPVGTGKAWLRELRAFGGLSRATLGPDDDAETPVPEGMQQGGGLRIGRGAVEALQGLQIEAAQIPAGGDALVVPRDDPPDDGHAIAALERAGARVARVEASGYKLAHETPEVRVVPAAVIRAAQDWYGVPVSTTDGAMALGTEPTPGPRAEVRGIRAGDVAAEQVVRMGPADGLVGVWAEPPAALRSGTGALFLNSGVLSHEGPHRLWVESARALAARGVPSLRLDFAGIGDSATDAAARVNHPYGPTIPRDVDTAVAWMRARGVERVVLVGLCSGAHAAFHAARAGAPVAAIVCVNPITWYWRESDPLDANEWMTFGEYTHYTSRVAERDAWQRLLTGKVNVAYVAQVFARRTRDVASAWMDRVRGTQDPRRARRGDLEGDLRAIVARGTRVTLVFGSREPGLDYLRLYARRAARDLAAAGGLHLAVATGPDHTFTPWGWRRWVEGEIARAVDRAVAEAGPA